MSHLPPAPPEVSSREDTPPAPLLERLRKITGVTEPHSPPQPAAPAPVPLTDAAGATDASFPAEAPPVDRLIEWLREFAGIVSQILVIAGLALAIAAVWLGHAIAGVLQWFREQIEDGVAWTRRKIANRRAAKSAQTDEVAAPPPAPPSTSPAPASEPTPAALVEAQPIVETPVATTSSAVPESEAKLPRSPAGRRRILIACGLTAVVLPALLLIPSVRYAVTTWLGWGNAAVVATTDGWLFPRRVEEAPPPASVVEAATALRSGGATLVVVSVPSKAAVYPEKLDSRAAGDLKRPASVSTILTNLTNSGVRVLDLGPVLHGLRSADTAEDHVFRLQSSYWSPRAVEKSAAVAAAFIQQQEGYAALPLRPASSELARVTVSQPLDDLGTVFPSGRWHSAHAQEPLRFIRLLSGDKKPMGPDASSPVLVIGGTPVLLYDSPALTGSPDGLPAGENLSAGFAQYLSVYLSTTMDVHAGDHSLTAARDWLQKTSETDRKSKRFIIWVISDDEILY